MCPKDYLPSLLKWVDPENLPRYLGGTSDATLIDDAGPWNDPQIRAEIEEDIAYRDGAAGEETCCAWLPHLLALCNDPAYVPRFQTIEVCPLNTSVLDPTRQGQHIWGQHVRGQHV